MPRDENPEEEEERKCSTAYDLIRLRLNRLEKNPNKLAPLPVRKDDCKAPKPPPDFVRNVVGSSAAAGSAEFHIYRNNRRKEQNRLEYMDFMAKKDELDQEYDSKKKEIEEEEEAKTAKKRAKRLRQKSNAKKARLNKKGKKEESDDDEEENDDNDGKEYENGSDEEKKGRESPEAK